MPLPTKRTQPITDLAAKSLLVYGPPKIGKSTFASEFPDALFLECEPGLSELEVYSQKVNSWEDFLAACREISEGKHKFKTIVVDTVDYAYQFCELSLCKSRGVEYIGDLAHGKGWSICKNEWIRVIRSLCALPYGVVFISHSTSKDIKDRVGNEYQRMQCTLPSRAITTTTGMMDGILYCDNKVTKDADGNYREERVIHTRSNAKYEAGLRGTQLPETIPLNYQAFVDAWNARTTEKGA